MEQTELQREQTLPLGVSVLPADSPLALDYIRVEANVERIAGKCYRITFQRTNRKGIVTKLIVSGHLRDVIRFGCGRFITFKAALETAGSDNLCNDSGSVIGLCVGLSQPRFSNRPPFHERIQARS